MFSLNDESINITNNNIDIKSIQKGLKSLKCDLLENINCN